MCLLALANLLSPLLTSLHELTLYEMYFALLSHEARLEHNATQDNSFEPNVASRQGPITSWLKRRMEDQGTSHQTSTLVQKISTLDLSMMVVEDQTKKKEKAARMEQRLQYSSL